MLVLALAVARGAALHADPPSASDTADRPGFADGPMVIGKGHVQLEGGVRVDRVRSSDGARSTVLTWPQAQLRVGVSARAELSVWWEGLLRDSPADRTVPATTLRADPRIGGKISLAHREAIDVALIGSVGLPAGTGSDWSAASPAARIAWGMPAPGSFDLSGTVDVAVDKRDGFWRPRPAASAAAGHRVGAGFDGFAGIVAVSGDEGSSLRLWSAEAGVTRALGRLRQIDVWGGRVVSGGPRSWFVGAGFVQRIH
jgi:Putative MetA-pathway of phenol degradation